jgi:hypothetical protein
LNQAAYEQFDTLDGLNDQIKSGIFIEACPFFGKIGREILFSRQKECLVIQFAQVTVCSDA